MPIGFSAAQGVSPLDPRREATSSPRFLLNSVDPLGREISPTVLSVANRIAPKAIPYAERLLGDPAVAMNLFEQAAASVSEAIKTKQASGSDVRDLAAYTFRAYIRLVSEAKRKDAALQASLDAQAEKQIWHRDLVRAEAALLLDEIMGTCDRLTREVAFRRLEGLSWKEIGERYGLSSHAVEARFSKALDRARKRLKIQNREG
jgi:RNA polymerase sigma factor (sigma-70 family)